MKHTLLTLLTFLVLPSPNAVAKPDNLPSEIVALQQRAQRGDVDALLAIGICYRDGRGVAKNHTEALKWYRMAADQGNGAGLDNVGYMHLRGWGVPEDFAIATAYFKASARTGHAQGLFNLGNSYYSGQGVEQDTALAIKKWQRAAKKNHPASAWRLAVLHASGDGVPQNWDQAEALCSPLAANGHTNSLLLLGEIATRRNDLTTAKTYWEQAAKNGSPLAKDLLQLAAWRHLKPQAGKYAYVEVDHLYQGWNNCGPTSTTMLARYNKSTAGPYDVKRLCPRSPIGTGTDWTDLVAAGKTLGQPWKLVTFTNDDAGFEEGLNVLRSHLDAQRPVVIDFTVISQRNGNTRRSGHTLLMVGYNTALNQFVLKNPNQPSPGIQLTSAEQLKKDWTSGGYSYVAKGKAARPLIVLKEL